jgi:hypothetical protein
MSQAAFTYWGTDMEGPVVPTATNIIYEVRGDFAEHLSS